MTVDTHTMSTSSTFWLRVEPAQADHCWLWRGALKPNGYADFRPTYKTHVYAHRWAYEQMIGPIPEGLQLDHLCRVRHCVNPYHLDPVTQTVNQRRGNGWAGRNYRKTHCKHGHEFTPENTILVPLGRGCRRCHADREAARRARLRIQTEATA